MTELLWTGATGFFGKALLRRARQADRGEIPERLHLLSRDPAAFAARHPALADQPGVVWHCGDVLVGGYAALTGITHVVHAAADSTYGDRLSPLQRYDQIVTGTRNMLDFAVANGVKRFLLTSSGGVYGRQPANLERIPEDYMGMSDPISPASAYGVAKRAAEHLCALYAEQHGLEVVIARCFAFVGQDLPLNVHFAIGNFIRDALWRDEIVVQGDGTAIRSYMDQRDLVDWLLTILERGESGRAYNVGSDEAISIADLAYLVRDTLSPEKPVRILGKAVGNAERNRYVPDVTKARRELGLKLNYSLRDAIGEAAKQRNCTLAD